MLATANKSTKLLTSMQRDTTENDVRNNNIAYMKNFDASNRNPKEKKICRYLKNMQF